MKHLEAVNRRIDGFKQRLARSGWYHSFELPDGTRIEGFQSLEALRDRVARMPIPENLAGKRVLDIGVWDGWMSFEMERRGAEVVAVDYLDLDTFRYIHKALGSRVDYRQMDALELSPSSVGYFDIVLCLGVLYHLKHPLLALEKVCAITRELAIIESFAIDDTILKDPCEGVPLMQFFETGELGGQLDNWWGPNRACLAAMCRTAGFARVVPLESDQNAGAVACYRKWEPMQASGPAPGVTKVHHNANGGLNFYTHQDEFVACWFVSEEGGLTRQNVYPEVSGYGVQPIHLEKINTNWLTVFWLPPGLPPGWHEVRLRTAASGWSNGMRIAVDLPAGVTTPVVHGVCDGLDWRPGYASQAGCLALWVQGLAENADYHNTRVRIGGKLHRFDYLSGPDEHGVRQLNLLLDPTLAPGDYDVVVRFGAAESDPAKLSIC